MKEIIAAVKTVIEQLRQAEILNLILGLAAALGVLLLFKFLTMFAGRRLEITPVRRSLKLLSLLTALMVFLMIMSSIEFLRILNSFVFFLIILVFIKITDYALVDRYLIHKKQLTITRLPRDTIKGIVFIALFRDAPLLFRSLPLRDRDHRSGGNRGDRDCPAGYPGQRDRRDLHLD